MMMKKLSEEHYIVVDDSEIKEGDWYLTFQNNEVIGEPRKCEDSSYNFIYCRKITHSTQPIEYEVVDVTPTGDAIEGYVYDKIQELSLSEVKELLGVVNKVEELSLKMGLELYVGGNYDFENGVRKGYNQALEDNKERKYTREDLLDAYTWGFLEGTERGDDVTDSVNKFSQALQPKTEWEVEIVDGKLKLIQ